MEIKPYYLYVDKVLNDQIITGTSIQLACKRFKADLQREDLIFREDIVDRAIAFIGSLKHFTGKHSGKPFILEE